MAVAESTFQTPVRWSGIAFTDGGAGMFSQVRGLLAAVGAPGEVCSAPLHAPWKWLWPGLIPTMRAIFAEPGPVDIESPPDLIVTCGRQSVMASLYLKKRFGTRVLTVHTQDPRIAPTRFDLVACPEHDGLVGPNIVGTFGALHHLTSELLAREAAAGPRCGLEKLAGPFTLVLLGGPTRNYAFDEADFSAFQARLEQVAATGQRLAILPSKRTPPRWIERFQQRFSQEHFVWSRDQQNPYLVALSLASHIVVTCDSVNMISEAATTGRPVYVEQMAEKRPARRFRRFHDSFIQAGITRTFTGTLDEWSYQPPNATQQVADRIRAELLARRTG
jgi:mitochondrial fission protein ELM1